MVSFALAFLGTSIPWYLFSNIHYWWTVLIIQDCLKDLLETIKYRLDPIR